MTLRTAGFGSAPAFSSKETVANATSPWGETCRAPTAEYGLDTAVTWGSAAICLSTGSMRARLAASVMLPVVVLKTIWSESPAWAGKFAFRRSIARWLCVPGREKLFSKFVPIAPDRAKEPMSSTIQPTMTVRRWAADQLATRATRPGAGEVCSLELIWGLLRRGILLYSVTVAYAK